MSHKQHKLPDDPVCLACDNYNAYDKHRSCHPDNCAYWLCNDQNWLELNCPHPYWGNAEGYYREVVGHKDKGKTTNG